MVNWHASASLANLKLRAATLARIREFFYRREVLEVETPLLATATVTDPHLHSMAVAAVHPGNRGAHFLQTSPEFAMKRLLASGSGSIYQLCKAFRAQESGGRHNPEFTMLEWYRVGFDEWQLMDEVEALVRELVPCSAIARLSYAALFQQHLGIDPHVCDRSDLLALARARLDLHQADYSRDDLLQLLLAQVIEPSLVEPCLVYHFPASMAALARLTVDREGRTVARRFELFMEGMEIANGYFELTDAREQADRFAADNRQRRAMGLPAMPIDEKLLAALGAGIPDCAGVALGVDRLMMVMSGSRTIDKVLAFPLLEE